MLNYLKISFLITMAVLFIVSSGYGQDNEKTPIKSIDKKIAVGIELGKCKSNEVMNSSEKDIQAEGYGKR